MCECINVWGVQMQNPLKATSIKTEITMFSECSPNIDYVIQIILLQNSLNITLCLV